MGNAFSFRRLTSAAIVGLITVSGVPLPVQAGPLVLTIDQPDRVGVNPGSTLDFTGTITNNTGSSLDAAADLFLNFNNFDSAVLSFDQLLGNPDFVLPNGATSADILLFDANVGLLATAAGSPYLADVQVQDSLGDLSNDVTISISVPEPASLTLLLGALVILISFTKRAKRVVTLYRLLPALAAAILSVGSAEAAVTPVQLYTANAGISVWSSDHRTVGVELQIGNSGTAAAGPCR